MIVLCLMPCRRSNGNGLRSLKYVELMACRDASDVRRDDIVKSTKHFTMTPLLFSTFEVTSQTFYRASLSFAIVNLKPILPGRKDFVKKMIS